MGSLRAGTGGGKNREAVRQGKEHYFELNKKRGLASRGQQMRKTEEREQTKTEEKAIGMFEFCETTLLNGGGCCFLQIRDGILTGEKESEQLDRALISGNRGMRETPGKKEGLLGK